jgi:S1-C subfamily serine protease
MVLKIVPLLLMSFCVALCCSESRADLKAAAGILKSTVVVEWRPDEIPGKKQAQADGQPATNATPEEGRTAGVLVNVAEAVGLKAAEVVEEKALSPAEVAQLYKQQILFATKATQASEAQQQQAFAAAQHAQASLYRNYLTQYTGLNANVGKNSIVTGSGFIVRPDGLVLTSISTGEGGKFSVILEDGRTLPGSKMIVDQRSGLMLLKVDATDLPAVGLCLDPVEIGQDAIAGMCTNNRTRSLRRGIVTGKNITVAGPCAELIPTDVAGWELISGAPLVNDAGGLIGVMTRQEEANPTGANHAIPTKFVKLLLDSLPVEQPLVIRKPFLGVQLGGDESPTLNLVTKVFEDSPAAKAGIQVKDVVVKVDEQKIEAPHDIVRVVTQHKRGDKVNVFYLREGKEQVAEVVLSEFPDQKLREVNVNVVQPPQVLTLQSPDGKTFNVLVDKPSNLTQAPFFFEQADAGSTKQPQAISNALITPGGPGVKLSLRPDHAKTLRVERSDLNQKLDELKGQVDALKTEVSKLTKILEQLEKKLNP